MTTPGWFLRLCVGSTGQRDVTDAGPKRQAPGTLHLFYVRTFVSFALAAPCSMRQQVSSLRRFLIFTVTQAGCLTLRLRLASTNSICPSKS